MTYSQRQLATAIDDRDLTFATVITQFRAAGWSFGFQLHFALQRLAIDRDLGPSLRDEEERSIAPLQLAQLVGSDAQTNVICFRAADGLLRAVDPVQTDQARPAIGLSQ